MEKKHTEEQQFEAIKSLWDKYRSALAGLGSLTSEAAATLTLAHVVAERFPIKAKE